MNRLISPLSAALLCLVAWACSDDRFDNPNPEIGEGEAVISAEAVFKTYTPALDSRTPGGELNGIENLYLIVYKSTGELYSTQKVDFTPGTNTDKPSDSEGVDEPISTGKATFSLKLPYGKYRIYAAANIRGAQAATILDRQAIATEDALKAIRFNWDAANIAANDQMFGYFQFGSDASQLPSGNDGNNFQAPDLTIDNATVSLTAWLRRLASKVTVGYDGSGLNENVFIYIKNVTIHDIPSTCGLGVENTPDKPSDLLNRRTNNQPGVNYVPTEANTRIIYEESNASHVYDRTQSGLEIYNGLQKPDGTPIIKGSDHGKDADALFFYENMQGNYEGQSAYDKRQQSDGEDKVGTNIRDDINGNDYKDRVKYGTYIEVEAFYVSINPANPSQGNIKYRFMLGKDIHYDYNAERNYHYKLTLGFRGWANQPDWHIDYDMPDPALEVPPYFRVSYLYHQKHSMPVKVSSNCTKLEVEILENNWAPCDPVTLELPGESVNTNPSTYRFQWNKAAYDSYYKKIKNIDGRQVNTGYPYLGFLALNMHADMPPTVPAIAGTSNPVRYRNFGEGEVAQKAVNDVYSGSYGQGTQGKSTFTNLAITASGQTHGSGHNTYTVTKVEDGMSNDQKVVMVPLWTRAKTIIEGSGFSGNNPYEYYSRKAILKVTGTYKLSEDNTTTITDYVTVVQEPRIVNPKAVWRSSSNNDPFHVVLMRAKNSNAHSDYEELISQGDWTAWVEKGDGVVSLKKSSGTVGTESGGKIMGKTGTKVDFDINFVGNGCGIVAINYHGNNCVHKIFVRKGYENPISIGGNEWSSYALYSATYVSGVGGVSDVYNAVQTASPLSPGSLYRRGMQTKAILDINNANAKLGPFVAPGNTLMSLANDAAETWSSIGFRDDRYVTANKNKTLGTFKVGGVSYKVPTLTDFENLKAVCEFGFGVLYGDGASETAKTYDGACGFANFTNSKDVRSDKGVRGVIAYNSSNGNQLFFSLGSYGYGRRRMFNFDKDTESNKYGMLIYADVTDVLKGSDPSTNNNVFRPVPYNLPITSGGVYWIDKFEANGHWEGNSNYPCLGWDVNYFNYDFNSYTANNYRDACLIKLIKAK